MTPAVCAALDEARAALGLDLCGRYFRFAGTTRRRFKVLRNDGLALWVRDGREERRIPIALLRHALAVGDLEECPGF